jgi:hypothetical protein
MAGTSRLSGAVLILLLAAVMWPQSSTPSAPAEPAPASSQAPVQAQPTEQKPAPVYESATVLKTITRLVVVDVVATDKNGPVANLERDDFTVLEDGKEQQIRVFNFQQPHAGAPATAAATTEKLPENVYSNVPKYRPDASLNVILLDGLNTTLPHQAYVRDQMLRYL